MRKSEGIQPDRLTISLNYLIFFLQEKENKHVSDNQNVLSGFEWQSGFCLHTSWMFGQEKENPRERKINRESEREKSEDLKSASLLITQLCHRMSEY